MIEKVVAARLLEHMNENSLLDLMQSAHRADHSTETALLRVHNDIVDSVDKWKGVFLVLLDLSAAFDTLDHKILLNLLKDYVGLYCTLLKLFESYLSGRTQCVSVAGAMSKSQELKYYVSQGSVLGPIEYTTIYYTHTHTHTHTHTETHTHKILYNRYITALGAIL